MLVPDINKLKGPQFTEKHFRLHYPELCGLIEKIDASTFQEKIYLYYNNCTIPTCKCCGGPVKFINVKEGYRDYCSRKCLNSDPAKKERVKQTCLQKYGGIAPACSKDVINKSIQTNLDRYGVQNAMQNERIKKQSQSTCIERYGGQGNASDELKKRQQETLIERYGTVSYNNGDKRTETLMTRYGVTHQSQLDSVRTKIRLSRRHFEQSRHDYILDYTEEGDWVCKCPDSKCHLCTERKYIISPLRYEGRINELSNPCTIANPIKADRTKDTSLELFVQHILDEYGIKYECNVVKLNKQHIDIYIPDLKLGFECNGVRYHRTNLYTECSKPATYHINKTNIANKLGIHLIHLWEDQIKLQPDIVRSIILNKIHRSPVKIGARKCTIESGKGPEYAEFFNMNHIQGNASNYIIYALRYNDEIVAAMSFGKRFNKNEGEWELVRFCNKINTNVVGAASRLLHAFIRAHCPQTIISFASRDISDGHLYKTLGFVSDLNVIHSYWYVAHKTLQRYHRSSFTKDNIIRLGLAPDKTKTEFEIMDNQPYFRIHDSGQTKWILNL